MVAHHSHCRRVRMRVASTEVGGAYTRRLFSYALVGEMGFRASVSLLPGLSRTADMIGAAEHVMSALAVVGRVVHHSHCRLVSK